MPRGHPGYTVHRASRALPLVLALGHREPTHPEAPRADPPARSLHPRIQRLRSILLPRVFGRCETVVPEWPHAALLDRMARWSDRRFSTLFLHDRAGTGFYGGVAGLGDTIDEVSTALQALIAKLEPSAILAVGEGLGGHAALVFGVLLGAQRIVAFEPAAHLIDDVLTRYNDRRWHRVLGTLPDAATARRFDVPALIARTAYSGQAYILFGSRRDGVGEDVHQNTVHAHWLARSDRVRLRPFPEVSEGVLDWLARRGQAESVLAHFLFETIDDPPLRGAPAPALSSHPNPPEDDLGPRISVLRILTSDPANNTGGPVDYAAVVEPRAAAASCVSDAHRRWIAESLLLDTAPGELLRGLVDVGIDPNVATREIDLAQASPYFRAACRRGRLLKERDRLLAVYRELDRSRAAPREIQRRHKLSRDELLAAFYTAGRCVIITGMIDDWTTMPAWSLDVFPQGPVWSPLADRALHIPEYQDPGAHRRSRFWIGPAGTTIPCGEDDTPRLLALVIGRLRVQVAALWDLPHLPETPDDWAPPRESANSDDACVPLDQPQFLEATLNAGELLFLPMGCRSRLQTLDDSVIVSFHDFVFDPKAR